MGTRIFLVAMGLLLGASACDSGKRPETEAEKRDRLTREEVQHNLSRLKRTKACEDCNLYGTAWPGADLRNAKLRGANLVRGDYAGADLRGADLTKAALGAFQGADLRGATLQDTFVSDAVLKNARLDGLDLRSIKDAESADWSGAIVRNADLRGVWFTGPYGRYRATKKHHFYSVPNSGALMVGVDLRGANLAGARLYQCNLEGADLRDADLTGAKLGASNLRQTKLEGAVLRGTDFSGADWVDGQTCQEKSIGQCKLSPDGT